MDPVPPPLAEVWVGHSLQSCSAIELRALLRAKAQVYAAGVAAAEANLQWASATQARA